MDKIRIKSIDGYELNLHIFEVTNSKGYIQIIHGMKEHQERYEKLVSFLNKNGYTVVTSNIRGHGDDTKCLGYFSDKDGDDYLLEDQKIITKYICKKYKTKKIIILAHSMGTIIARNLLMTESRNYEKVILIGYPCPQKLVRLGIFITTIIRKIKGNKYHSQIVENLSVGRYNKKIKNTKTDVDWISFNEDNIDNYLKDSYCGHEFKIAAFNDLFYLVKNMGNYKLYKNVNNKLPLLLLRGDSDPCTGYDKGSYRSKRILNKTGFINISEIKYKNMRHEILNEKNYKLVYKDILLFLNN